LSTSEPINCPLFEFLKRDVGSWRGFVKIEAVGVFLLFVEWQGELLLLMVYSGPPLGIDTIVV